MKTETYILAYHHLLKALFFIPFIALPFFSFAQVCSGSLGDAVVKVDFGAGSGLGAPLPPSVISYNYVAQDCPNDGSYTIINRTNGCFSNTWYVYPEDHTPGDINGYMMLVNSSLQPNDFYVDTVRGLCPNTTYEFSAWLSNVIIQNTCNNNPTAPNVRFTIESVTGVVLGSYTTGNIPAKTGPEWEKYGLFFTTNNTDPSVVIRMRNNAPGGCGNDIALDDISFRPCGPLVTSTINGNGNSMLCEGIAHNINISATIGSGYNNPRYQWQTSLDNGVTWNDIAGANSINYTSSISAVGTYLYRLAVAEGNNILSPSCRVVSNNILFEIKPRPVAVATVTSPVCTGATVELTSTASNSYIWTGPNSYSSTDQNPSFSATLNSAGTYALEITDGFGCKGTTSVSLIVNQSPNLLLTKSADTVCAGTNVTFTASGANDYSWSPTNLLNNSTGSSVNSTVFSTSNFKVIGTTTNGCKDSIDFSIVANPLPSVNAGADKTVTTGQALTLDGVTNSPNNILQWTPSTYLNNPNILTPISTPIQDIDYTITAVSPFGCGTVTDEVSIKVFKGVFIPNSFTPNADGINDFWKVPALAAFPSSEVSVYDRYGAPIYFSKQNSKGWDGRYKGQPATSGAYTYIINLKNGSPFLKGSLMLIR